MPDRPSLDDTLMAVARTWAERSTCGRLHVGAVLARDGRTLSSGYNGAPAGEEPCGCQEWVGTHEIAPDSLIRPAPNPLASVQVNKGPRCDRSVHAELNCLLFAARHGVSSLGASMYCTDSPCLACAGAMVNAGIAEVVFARPYRLDDGVRRLEAAGITVRRLGEQIEPRGTD